MVSAHDASFSTHDGHTEAFSIYWLPFVWALHGTDPSILFGEALVRESCKLTLSSRFRVCRARIWEDGLSEASLAALVVWELEFGECVSMGLWSRGQVAARVATIHSPQNPRM